MTPEQIQSYWDASMILSWRRFQLVLHAEERFETLTNLTMDAARAAGVLRLPPPYIHKNEVRLFVGQFLPKIGQWMEHHDEQDDVRLLEKLAASHYDTRKGVNHHDPAIAAESRANTIDRKRNAIVGEKKSRETHKWGWKVMK